VSLPRRGCLEVAGIILAAGAATRMGQTKQLLPFQNQTLLGHVVDVAVDAGLAPVIVVIGAEADAVQRSIAHKAIELVRNVEWPGGMGSSITAGMRHLRQANEESAAVALLSADQPLITSRHVSEMKRLLHTSNADAVAAEYSGTLGIPAIFSRKLFARLAELSPTSGAKALLRDPQLRIVPFPLPEAATDIDTPEDFAALSAT
jgi:molybdenum cofactor cytidylyltransferase